MNLQNWVYQHCGNTGLYYTPLPGHTVTVDLDLANPSGVTYYRRSDLPVAGFMWGINEHMVTRIWLAVGVCGVVEFNPGTVIACSDYELSDILIGVKA